ncbi:uncharacterized protein LOC142327677 [Lycorma delicatula]|uniref:uncharacterized protein LOC142327677 n=1 Tax=Lycorma delicatula TaxID=130591 RepID=UPI003F5152A9
MKYIYYKLISVVLIIEIFINAEVRQRCEVTEITDFLSTTTKKFKLFKSDASFLRALYRFVIVRYNQTIEEARYKWRNGIKIPIPKGRYDEILKNAERQSQKKEYIERNILANDIVQYMKDVIKASTLIEYSLISDWNANNVTVDGITPDGPGLSLSEIYAKQDEVQPDIVERFARIADLRKEVYCGDEVGKEANDKKLKLPGHLFRIALEVSMSHFCKIYIAHKSPHEPRSTRIISVKKMYRDKAKKYAIPLFINETTTLSIENATSNRVNEEELDSSNSSFVLE